MSRPAPVRFAVFPVAGRGTRFLPATKASPKEMLPVVDKPLIQYAVDEALAAGARMLVFITGASKRAIEDHFDTDAELEGALEAQGKADLLALLRGILPSDATCIYIRQPAPLGLGHAVLCAQAVVGDEPFYVHLADDLMQNNTDALRINEGGWKIRRLPTSVDLLGPNSPALKVLACRPAPPGTHYHSILGVYSGAGADSHDGVVVYSSAHLDEAESELLVPAHHICVHHHPRAMLEVRRILHYHLQQLSARPVVLPALPAPHLGQPTGR